MTLFIAAILIPIAGGGAALAVSRRPKIASWVGAASAVVASLLGLVAAFQVLVSGEPVSFMQPWHVPYGSFSLGIDALSAVFLIPMFGLGGLAAVFGGKYLMSYSAQKSLGVPWFFFNILLSSMALVVTARNGILFLVCWETMALASYFLVVFEDEKPEVRNAGRIYLIATHAGTSFLLAFFAILGREADSLEFAAFSGLATLAPATASALFLLALVGFGAKAGLVPMHIWLPEAHPAAPSHVSAIMSGVMIKTGIYGILRALTFFGALPAWWGVLLIGVGLTSGILGVLFALAQHDLKRLLAYHSVENIGIITLGMGVGVWGMGHGAPTVALLGFAGALLHVVNHAAFKGLLFLNAGSVLHATGAREMDHLGGLLKKMPVTGGTFLIAAIAISGLPPLNGFVSEFLILLGSLKGAIAPSTGGAVALLALMAGLVLIGGLAVACFSKAFGVAFLGSPRTEHATHAHEAGLAFSLPMLTLAALCVFIGIAAVVSVRVVLPAAAQLVGVDTSTATSEVASWSSPLARVTLVALIVAGFGGALAWVRMRLLAGRKVETAVTWDCGYEHPNARMQYTATSYAQPLLAIFRAIVRQRTWFVAPRGYLPASGGFHAETPDPFVAQMYRPISAWVGWATSRLHWLQQGRVHVYLLYIFITLVILLVWGVGF